MQQATFDPGEATSAKTYVNMRVRRILKWTHISEVRGCRITPFSEPCHHKRTLISEVCPQISDPFLSSEICIILETHISELCHK